MMVLVLRCSQGWEVLMFDRFFFVQVPGCLAVSACSACPACQQLLEWSRRLACLVTNVSFSACCKRFGYGDNVSVVVPC